MGRRATYLDVTLRRTRKRVDHEREDVTKRKMCRVYVARRSGLVLEVDLGEKGDEQCCSG
jgi:hypothetical protein